MKEKLNISYNLILKNELETLNVLKVSELIMLETEFKSKVIFCIYRYYNWLNSSNFISKMEFLEAENTKYKDMCDKRIVIFKFFRINGF